MSEELVALIHGVLLGLAIVGAGGLIIGFPVGYGLSILTASVIGFIVFKLIRRSYE